MTPQQQHIRDAILGQLQANSLNFQHITHEHIDAHQVAKEVGVAVQEGIKCLIMRGKKSGTNYLICVLGHQRVDMHALAELTQEKCEFEKAEVIKERYGLEVGGIPPFGNFLGLDIYFDVGIQNCQDIIFSCGLVNESVRMRLGDLLLLIQPRFVRLVKG